MLACIICYLGIFTCYSLYRAGKIPLKMEKKVIDRGVLFFLCTTTIACVLEFGAGSERESLVQIERRGYGEGTRKETMWMQVEGREEELVDIEVSARKYSDEDLQQLCSEAMQMIEAEILGENKSPDYVTENLHLIRKIPGYPFSITWGLDRYDVMNMEGILQQEVICQVDPEQKGIPLTLTAKLRCEEKEALYSMNFLIFAKKRHTLSWREKVLDCVGEADEETLEEAYMTLPSVVEDRKVTWSRGGESRTTVILLLGGFGSFLLIGVEKQKKTAQRKEQQKQMLFDYPEIISQFLVLMSSGMTVKKVWKKIVEDYQKQRTRTGRVRRAYEEMEYTWQEMQSGVAEVQCYEHFARRCELLPYMKLGALLAQNLRKGSRGIWEQLEIESFQAMEERKNQIKKLGEEAGTKLLLPMLLMLLVVLAIVILPAFLSIRM